MKLSISCIKIWDTPDPYPLDAYYKLVDFTERLNGEFNGDLAHLVSYDGGGGIAYIDVLCYKYNGTGYSGLAEGFSEVPYYSWTVEVIAHELGHNIASPHTHSCKWGPSGN